LHQVCGVDLTKIPGIKEQSAQIIISEVGLDMSRWNTEKQFSSFLGLGPNNLITGGKILRQATRKVYNRAADTLRLCAQSLTHSKSALGAKYRRLRVRLGAPKPIVAMAHHLAQDRPSWPCQGHDSSTARKLACLVYHLLKYKQQYREPDPAAYQLKVQKTILAKIQKQAAALGYKLLPTALVPA
jgi:hypothetical protein